MREDCGMATVAERLRAAGSVFAEEEARLLGGDERLIERRIAGERLEHVLGWTEFAGVRIAVDAGVFIPRPQTEELALAAAAMQPSIAVDLFSGSGAIACVVKAANPGCRVVAADADPAALACTRRNAERFGIEVVRAHVDAGLPPALAGRVDVVTANVPYVPTAELAFVPHAHEPSAALDGGPDGLHWLRSVAEAAPRWLRPGGTLLVELPESGEQRAAALEAVRGAGLEAAAPAPESRVLAACRG